MQKYIGVKIIEGEPQDCQKDDQQNKKGDPGFKVVYEGGYISWSPEKVFKDSYRPIDAMTFGLALEALKKGLKVARKGWNGKNMWLVLIHAGNAMAHGFDMQNCIGMKTAQNVMQPGWLASQPDMLAEDWVIVEYHS